MQTDGQMQICQEKFKLSRPIGRGYISPVEAKVTAIMEKDRPRTKKELLSYLGSTGYYRRFIKDYARVAAPH